MTAKAKCRQDALCKREHFHCDVCGREVHAVKSTYYASRDEYDAPDVCVMCSTPGPWRDRMMNEAREAEQRLMNEQWDAGGIW